ncbi:hypothetical protein Tco_1258074 [Tanacetum coccineum]
MIESKKPMKKKELIRLNEEIASKLQAEFDEEVRFAREKAEKEQEANVALTEEWDDSQAKIEDDHELAQRLQAQEQEELSDAEKATLFNRAGEELEQKSTKKQKVDEDKDTTELQSLMEVIPDEEEVAIDVVPLATKPPTITNWKIHKEGKKSYYQLVRADRKSQMYIVFSLMLKNFSREDLEDLYNLVKAKYKSTRPVEDLDLVL